MPEYKTCPNGHNFDAGQYKNCPYCPANMDDSNYEKTLSDFKNTQIMEGGTTQQFQRTMISEENDMKKTPVPGKAGDHPFKRTQIANSEEKQATATEKRKIVGWLVTFSQDEFGHDYKLYAGKNRIGSATGSDILIADHSVSADHLTILFRENEFLFKDNFSTNGTKINGQTISEGKLAEGDVITLGNTQFKFKTVF
jgi:hypothetical protein